MKLTVGHIENLLRSFDKGIEVSVGCNSCNHGSIGSTENIEIIDRTNQTYGYIELVVNAKHKGDIELNPDKQEFYTKEIEKFKKEIKRLNEIISIYEDTIENVSNIPGRVERLIGYVSEWKYYFITKRMWV